MEDPVLRARGLDVADGRVQRTPVRAVEESEGQRGILEGIEPGARVVVDPPAGIEDGARVSAGGG